ncbi:MAG: hypothetical protein VB934_18200 [Polyangiaceae bacterium]
MIVTTEGFARFTSGAKLIGIIGKPVPLGKGDSRSPRGDDAVTVAAAIGFADSVDALGVGAVSR